MAPMVHQTRYWNACSCGSGTGRMEYKLPSGLNANTPQRAKQRGFGNNPQRLQCRAVLGA
jgi:hypothetical protein